MKILVACEESQAVTIELRKLGHEAYSCDIDKYAKQVAMKNYPDIIQMGDAFDLRDPAWSIGV